MCECQTGFTGDGKERCAGEFQQRPENMLVMKFRRCVKSRLCGEYRFLRVNSYLQKRLVRSTLTTITLPEYLK